MRMHVLTQKSEEATASSASLLATSLKIKSFHDVSMHVTPCTY